MNIGTRVRVIAEKTGCLETEESLKGKCGTLLKIDEHHEDGDFYGVRIDGQDQKMVFYFWREELEPIKTTTNY